MDTPVLDLIVTARNARMRRYREQQGLTTSELAVAAGVSYKAVWELETFRLHPQGTTGEWRPTALRIAEYFGVGPDDLWPPALLSVRHAVVRRELGEADVDLLVGQATLAALGSPEDACEADDRRWRVREALLALSPREQRVLQQRFGFGGERGEGDHGAATLRTAAASIDVTPERTRQVELRALARLRRQLVDLDKPSGMPRACPTRSASGAGRAR